MEQKIPENFLNNDGTLNTDSLLKSYIELEKKVGTMISIPQNDDTDSDARKKFNRAIGVPENANEYPKNDLYDDEHLRQKFLEIGLNKTQVEKIYDIANEFLSPVIAELFSTQQTTNALNELSNYFGGTEQMTEKLRAIKDFGERFFPHDAFDVLCSTPQGIQGVYKMMQSMEPDIATQSSQTKNITDADLRRMMRDPKYWRDNDKEYIRKIENGFKKLYS